MSECATFSGQMILFLYAEKYQETKHFCEDILGLSLVLDQGGCRIYRTGLASYIGYCDRKDSRVKNGIIITLVAEDVDGWYQILNQKKVQLLQEPVINELYGIYHFFFYDPNGYLFEIQRFLAPFPPIFPQT